MEGSTNKTLSIPVREEFLDKSCCLKEAQRIIREGLISEMTELQLAREIYFHAYVYYYCLRTGRFARLKDKADPIDICDGGDSGLRRAAFTAGWLLPGRRYGGNSQ